MNLDRRRQGAGDAVNRIEADYVIVGAGSAGCVLANRLSEDPSVRVVLLEAGSHSNRFLVDMPAGIALMIGDPRYDWCYLTEPDPSIGNRTGRWAAGRMLGGGSAINGMVYIRGTRLDYDGWAAADGTGRACFRISCAPSVSKALQCRRTVPMDPSECRLRARCIR